MSKRIKIFDTTLRDGEQAPGCSMNLQEKIEIAKQLERLGVDVIEAGFAISSAGDFESVKTIASVIKDCTVASLSRATEKDILTAYEAVKHTQSPRIHTFIATSPVHMEFKLKMSPEKVLERIEAMVKYAKSLCPDVEFSAEDAMRSEPAFLAKVTQTAIAAGANVINVPDTVGYVTPSEIEEMVRYLIEHVPNIGEAELSMHCHNDLGMAVANSLAGVQAGATQVECTINGLGERAGNAALEELVMALHTRKNLFEVECNIDTTQLYRTSRLVSNVIGQPIPMNKPIVGANAFAHESGIHQHGVMSNKKTYEIMTPESVGLKKNKMVLGKHSGKHAFGARIAELGYTLTEDEIEVYFKQFKDLCDKKKSVNDNDIEAIVNQRTLQSEMYKLEQFEVQSGNKIASKCEITLKKGEELFQETSRGEGPVNAAYNAIDKIVCIGEHSLEDYAIHSVSEGNDALGEVIVKIRYGGKTITGRGLSADIIESSILAYINGINKIVSMEDSYAENRDI